MISAYTHDGLVGDDTRVPGEVYYTGTIADATYPNLPEKGNLMNIDFTLLLVLLLFAAFIVQTVINWRLVMLIAFGAERFIKHDVTKREIGVDKIHARVGAETQRRQQDELAALLNPDQENLPRPPIDASAIAMGKGKETY